MSSLYRSNAHGVDETAEGSSPRGETRHPVRLLKGLICGLVDRPEDVRMRVSTQGDVVRIEVRTHPSDVGKAIGRGGRYMDSMRDIFSAIYAKEGSHVVLSLEGAIRP